MTGPALQTPEHARGRCKSCHAPLIWAKTTRGKWMPLDAEEVLVKGETLWRIDEQGVVQRAAIPRGHRAHHVTCPFADQYRRSR